MDAKANVQDLALDEVGKSDACLEQNSQASEQIVVSDTGVPTKSDDKVLSQEELVDQSDDNIATGEEPDNEDDDGSNDDNEKEKPGLLDLPAVVDGRRNRATVQRLSMQTAEIASPKSAYKGGIGVSLGSIDYIGDQLDKHLSSELKTMHRLLFGTPGKQNTVKREIRGFSGFDFGEHDVSFLKRTTMCYKLTGNELKFIKNILGLNMHGYGSTKDQLVTAVMIFLLRPEDHHRKVVSKKRKASTSGSAKKTKKAKKDMNSSGGSESDGEEDAEVQAKTPKKTSTSKSAPKKTKAVKRAAVKVKTSDGAGTDEAAIKNEDKNASEDDNIEGSPDVSNESDESTTPVEKSKSKPSEDTIVETIKDLLDTFDLSQVSMKQMCQAVMEKFPGSDLEDRKSWLKEKIKAQLLNVK